MKKGLIILIGFLAAGLFAACSLLSADERSTAVPSFPTATSHFLFSSSAPTSTPATNSSASFSGAPTVASIFQKPPKATPSLAQTATPTPELAAIQILPSHFYTVTVYADGLNPNWEVQKGTGMKFNLKATSPVYRGQSAISFTPQGDDIEYASLLFTLSDESQEAYPRDRVAELSFWLYSGEAELPLDQLAVTIVGSNHQPFWSANDHSVTVDDDLPVFSETRLYYLGFNHTIPADTWVPVTLDLDKTLIYDPDYKYVTGFYLKTEAGFSRTIVIDDVNLLMLDVSSETAAVEVTPSLDTPHTPGDHKMVTVQINTQKEVHSISELIYGVSGASAEYLQALRPTLNSWGAIRAPGLIGNWAMPGTPGVTTSTATATMALPADPQAMDLCPNRLLRVRRCAWRSPPWAGWRKMIMRIPARSRSLVGAAGMRMGPPARNLA